MGGGWGVPGRMNGCAGWYFQVCVLMGGILHVWMGWLGAQWAPKRADGGQPASLPPKDWGILGVAGGGGGGIRLL